MVMAKYWRRLERKLITLLGIRCSICPLTLLTCVQEIEHHINAMIVFLLYHAIIPIIAETYIWYNGSPSLEQSNQWIS